MRYVSEVAAARAREITQRFQALPPDAGIIFVAVAAVPIEGGDTRNFDICLGLDNKFEHHLGINIIQKVLERELSEQLLTLRTVDVFCGVPGAACGRGYESDEGIGPH